MATDKHNLNAACPLCGNTHAPLMLADKHKSYYACDVCGVRFLGANGFLSREEEFAHYQTHENDLDDLGYRRFLSKLADPLLSKLSPKCSGLDYGCGPAPLLAQMMREAGHEMALYDPFYHPHAEALTRSYDFITCTEVAEHFHNPKDEFEKLFSCLKPGGWLAVMTCFQTDDAKFATWQYRHDPTHIVFYKKESFAWLAAHYNAVLEVPRKDVVLLQKLFLA